MFDYPHGDLHGLNLDWFLEQWKKFQQSFTGSFTASSETLPATDDPTVNINYDQDTGIYDFHFGIPNKVKPTGFQIGYQASNSGTTVPTGTWLANPPAVPQGDYLWSMTRVIYNDGQYSETYAVSRMGVDGTGSVSTVNSVSPDGSGNILITASDIKASDNETIQKHLNDDELAISGHTNAIGDMTQLDPVFTATDLVGVANELLTDIDTVNTNLSTDIGDMSQLMGLTATDVIGALNELCNPITGTVTYAPSITVSAGQITAQKAGRFCHITFYVKFTTAISANTVIATLPWTPSVITYRTMFNTSQNSANTVVYNLSSELRLSNALGAGEWLTGILDFYTT